jgi:GT2 family glycosyltransferase
MISEVLIIWAIVSLVVTNGVLLAAALFARTYAPQPACRRDIPRRPVLLVRPFRGADDRGTHQSLLGQTYRPYRARFICTSRDDPGLPEVRAACSLDPDRADCLLAEGCDDAVSDKARNMIAAWRSSDEPFVGFCDSDIELHEDAIATCMAEFDDDRVGAVFAHCIIEASDWLGRVAMLTLTADAYAFIFGCARGGYVPFLEGGLMILRRDAVARAGGIEIIADAIGDDTRLGQRLLRSGYQLRLAPFSLVHRSSWVPVIESLSRYRRWIACHRTELAPGFWAEFMLNPTVASLVAATIVPLRAWPIVLANIVLRTFTTVLIDRTLLRRHGVGLGWWMCARPIADVLHFLVCATVLVFPWVSWRGIRYAITPRGRVVRVGEPGAAATESAVTVESGTA